MINNNYKIKTHKQLMLLIDLVYNNEPNSNKPTVRIVRTIGRLVVEFLFYWTRWADNYLFLQFYIYICNAGWNGLH